MATFTKATLCGTGFALCALILSATPAKADIDTIRSSDRAVWGAFGTSFFNYKEEIPSPDLADSEHGYLPSLAGGVSYMSRQDLYYLALEGAVSFGSANYNGAYQITPTTPLQATTQETISSIYGRVGKGFPVYNSVMLIPYVELGYHYWDRNLGGGEVEDYQNFDGLGGLMVQVSPTNRLILTGYGSAGTTFGAQMQYSPNTYNLGGSGIYKLGGKIGYDLTQKVEVFTTLDYEYFRYGQSAVASDGSYEPNSRTENTAARVGLSYHL